MFSTNIEQDTKNNSFYRKVIHTTDKMQLVLMSLNVGENIDQEIHDSVDQFFRIESGIGEIITPEKTIQVKDGDVIIIPGGTQHEVKNIGNTELKLYTIYTPPNHPPNTIHRVKNDDKEHDKYHVSHSYYSDSEKTKIYKKKAKKYIKKYLKLFFNNKSLY